MAVTSHIRSDEHPLRELVGLEIFIEKGGVLDVGKSVGIGDHRVIENLGA